MTDALRRSLRTLAQALIALAAGVPTIAAAFDLDAVLVAKVGAVLAVATAVITAAVNGLEDRGTIPALLKAPASDGADPVPDPAG